MREDDNDGKVKHACKFCDKSFPSGRQLGGHMRSHQNPNNNPFSEPDGTVGKKIRRKKIRVRIKRTKGLDPGENFGCGEELGPGGSRGSYVLRENPRKSWRIAADESREDMSSDGDKSCRECGRGFGSWKALFGHMKRHALEDRDSRTGDDRRAVVAPTVVEEDSRLDNEEVALPSTRMRFERRKAYMVAAASSSSLSPVNSKDGGNDGGNHNYTASSVSEIDRQQEEVAMCLMMLSRDICQWKVSDSVFAGSSEAKRPSPDTKKVNCSIRNSGSDNVEVKDAVVQDRKRSSSSSSDLNNSEQRMKTQKEFVIDEVGFGIVSGVWVNLDKRARFECTTCKKVFHSYQALGGHKASHSKIRDGFFSTKIDSKDNSVKAEISHPMNNIPRKNGIVGKKHECLVCLKVFPSGQALGGHKRSHMQQGSVAEDASKQFQHVVAKKQVTKVRDAFDLNLPAQIEDEGSSHVTVTSRCMDSTSHSQEWPLAGF